MTTTTHPATTGAKAPVHTPATWAWAVLGLLLIAGVMIFATYAPPPSEPILTGLPF